MRYLKKSHDSIDTTSKDSSGWKKSMAGFRSWTLECDGFMVDSDTAYTTIETAFNAGTTLEVELLSAGGQSYQGSAFVTDFPVTAPNDAAATIKITLEGTGALTMAAAL